MRVPKAREVERVESNVRMLHRRKRENEFTGTIKVESEKITGSITYLEGTPVYARTEDGLEGWKAIEKLREYGGPGVSIYTSTREKVRIFRIYVNYLDDNGLVRAEEKEVLGENGKGEDKKEKEESSKFLGGILGG